MRRHTSFDSAQDVPLLTTKLYIPPPRPTLVSRPRLIEQLNAGMTRNLTLISAPAGFGKTTLLSEWVAGSERPAALAVGPLFFVHIPQPKRADEGRAQKQSIWADLGDGLRYLRGWSGLMVLIGFALIFKIALTPAISLIPVLVYKHFGGGAAQLSLVEAVAGIGIIMGGLLLSIWGGFKRKITTVMTAITIFSLSFLVLGLTPAGMFGVALVSMFVVGLMVPMIDGPVMAILQGTVAPEMQGRVFTMMNSLLNLTGPISLAFAGPVSDWLGLQVWYVAAGVLCGVLGVLGFFIPAIMNIEKNNNGAAAFGEKMPTANVVSVPMATN